MTTPFETCDLRPFLSKVVTSHASPEQTASSVHIFVQQLELWLRQLKAAVCADLVACCNNPPAGVTKFTQLSDVPSSYVGAAGEFVRVNATQTALEFFNLTATLVTTFLQLADVPHSYSGAALKAVRVNAAANALEFFTQALVLLSDFPASYSGAALKALRVNAGATAVEFFTQALTLLSDFPASYSGQALKALRVNAGATAVEFFSQLFTLLGDVPSSYSGAALKGLRVNAGATAVEFFVQALTLLSDFPASYAGAGLKVLRVNAGATAVEFFTEVFTALGDAPTSYSGAAGKVVVVNSTETGLEFSGGSGPQSPTAIQLGKVRSAIFPTSGGTMVIGPTQSNDGAGGITTPALVSTTLLDSTWRCRFQSAAGAGNEASVRTPQLLVTRGSAAGSGGFRFSARWATSLGPVAQQRSFVGVIGITVAIGNVNPTTLTDLFGIGYNSTDAQLSIIYNDGSGTATKDSINGGTGFPVDATTLYEVVFSCAPNSTTIEYIIRNLTTGLSESGQKTTNLPTNTVGLAPQMWVNNGTTASAVRIDMVYMQLELYG